MIARVSLALSLLALTACGNMTAKSQQEAPDTTAAAPKQVTQVAAAAPAPRPRPSARTVADLDTTTAAQKAAAAAKPAAAAERKLGNTVASLGDPTDPGFWIKTPLVKAETDGRIVNPANGKSARVRLIPLAGPVGAGSQVSLPALRLLGVSLTDLPTLEVYSG